jgi:hypothetical protein
MIERMARSTDCELLRGCCCAGRPHRARPTGEPPNYREEDQAYSRDRHRGWRQHQAPSASHHQHPRKWHY